MNKNTVILEIFDFLKQRGMVETQGEFSEWWLGQCDSYYRGLRFKRTEPSIGVVAIVGSRLQKAGEQIIAEVACRRGTRCNSRLERAGTALLCDSEAKRMPMND